MRGLKKLGVRGDTIVEVLIAITVVSAVMVSAYAVVNRTAKNTQQNQEHNEALKLLEGQVERLKSISADPTSPIYVTSTGAFCIDNSNAILDPTVPANMNTSVPGNCTQGLDGRYELSIVKGPGNPNKTFTATAEWDSIVSGKDRVELIYKVYPQTP